MIATFKTSDFVSNLKAALYAVSQDVTRAHLCQLRVELSAGVARFIATNGHWLWVNEVRCFEVVGVDEKGSRVLGTSSEVVQIYRDDVKEILKILEKGKKASNWDVELDTSGAVSQIGKRIPFTPRQGVFPPYRQVIPATVLEKGKVIAYDPKYLADVSAAFAEVASNPKECGICLQPSAGELDPVVVTSDTSSALAVLMPRRLDKGPKATDLVDRYRAERPKAA